MYSTPISTFGAWIRARRRSLGLTQAQLGTSINYSVISIRKLESGERSCSEELAILLVSALEVPTQYQFAFMQSARTGFLNQVLQAFKPDDARSTAATLPEPVKTSKRDTDPPNLSQYAQPTTQLFGRETDIAQVLAQLQQPSTRLITLHGPPGVGKSRLGAEVLRQADPLAWPDGKFFVPLAHIDHATLIPEAIAATMGIREANTRKWRNTEASQSVYQFVKHKQVLLVLDNFEHLHDGVLFLLELLAAAPLIKVIVTSRSCLNVWNVWNVSDVSDVSNVSDETFEALFPVNPLTVLEATALTPLSHIAQNAAVALFMTRAQSRRHSFQLTRDNATTIVELCQRLGGLPLALELAAVHLKLQTPAELLSQFMALPQSDPLRQQAGVSYSNTLQVLNHGTKDMPPRHHSLLGALNWSYNLLTPDAQIMFDQLGVFQGGFTRKAALAVAQGSLKSLEELASQSLIQVQASSDKDIRLSMLEVMREFALIKLDARGITNNAKRRHAQYLAALLQRLDNNPPGPDELDSVEIVSAELANMRAALSWCLENDLPIGFTLGRYLNHHWVVNGDYHEGRAWTTQLLKADDPANTVSPESRAYLLCVGTMLNTNTPLKEVKEQLELFRRLGITDGMAIAEGIMGWIQIRSSPTRSEQHLGSAISVLEADGRSKSWLSATLRMFRAVALYTKGEFGISEQLLNEAIQIHTQMRDGRGLAHAQNYLAWLHFAQGDYEVALELAQRVLLMNQRFKDAYSMGRAFATKAFAEIELGQLIQAKASAASGRQVVDEAGVVTMQSLLLHVAGRLAFFEGNGKGASQLYLQSMSKAQQLAQTDYIPLSLISMAQIAITDATHASQIVQWLSAVQAIAREMEYHLPLSYQTVMDQVLNLAKTRLDEESYIAAQMQGYAMSLVAAITLAQTTTNTMPVEVA